MSSTALHVPRSLLLLPFLLHVASSLSVGGNSTFDNQVNKILHWTGDDFGSLGLGPEIVAGVAIGAGLLATFLGYKLVRPTIFLAGFTLGSVGFFLLAERLFANASYIDTACWIAFFVGGFLVGSFVLWLYKLGIFCVGALAGVLLATQIHNSFGYLIYPSSPNTVLIVLLIVLGLGLGFVALKLERPFLVFASSCFGAIGAVWGIGFFAGGYPNAAYLQKTFANGDWIYHIPSSWWYYLAGTTVLCGLGIAVQFQELNKTKRAAQSNAVPADNGYYITSASPAYGNPVRHV
ncbi:hypothetical protein SPRG_13469 [Saprolegnia parasitica CBS 223.65]|uniref:Transmembrane protein 198 n=1 Tax=Saprolegnia parasitica (strain CBS 223.65) TaxID=695850 RepID=A0A067BP29_SAPPC|nr:hypothetical protein SPRG_13469 [Saprolegnia parasitica CBS 223.65]KDO20214.1 hypothetical protein SPRG_13469 [Saprolegnia parasitica CBS 223.65]|eukprot:XP_012209101.1 hypothetical protein SPRG_13469 [Saprolegnia parasitica CBS 223.65]